jgi:hypothetical protein
VDLFFFYPPFLFPPLTKGGEKGGVKKAFLTKNDGDGSFSSSKHVPRFRLENHVKELELFHKIQEYVNSGNLLITSPRKNRLVSNPTVVLEINNIHVLKNKIVPRPPATF